MAALAALAMGAFATSADAHPKLKSVIPAADVSSKVSPKEIKLNFSEGVIAKFSGLELKNEAGKTITTGVPVNDPGGPEAARRFPAGAVDGGTLQGHVACCFPRYPPREGRVYVRGSALNARPDRSALRPWPDP